MTIAASTRAISVICVIEKVGDMPAHTNMNGNNATPPTPVAHLIQTAAHMIMGQGPRPSRRYVMRRPLSRDHNAPNHMVHLMHAQPNRLAGPRDLPMGRATTPVVAAPGNSTKPHANQHANFPNGFSPIFIIAQPLLITMIYSLFG